MTKNKMANPKIVPQIQWLAKRKKLLAHEKALTKQHDRVSAERRRLSMVKIEKDYVFDGSKGKQRLKNLFEGRRQLISITSCSTRRGTRAAQPARVM